MADKELYDQSNLKELNQFPKINCKIHHNLFYEAISLNSSYNNVFACMKCIISEDLKGKYLIYGEDFFTQNQNEIIKNWPPLQNSSLQQVLMDKEVQEYNYTGIALRITQLFDELKSDTLKIIDEHLKRILSHINIVEENRENTFLIYNQIAEKNEIRKQISDNYNDLNLLEQNLKTIINKKLIQLNENEKILKDSLDTLSNSMKKIKFENLQNVTSQFLIRLKSMDFLNQNLTEDIQKESDQLMRVNKIYDFLRKTNNCSDEFLNKLKAILVENKQIFSQLNLCEFNSEDIKAIKSKQIFDQNCMYYEQSRKQFLNQKENLLQNIKIVKVGELNKISHKIQENGEIVISSNKNIFDQSTTTFGKIYIDKQILPNKRYEIKIRTNSGIYQQNFTIGLLTAINKDSNENNDRLSINACSKQSGIDKIEKGNHLSEIINDVREITFQISLNEKILRCLAMANNQKNINSIQDKNNLSLNTEYYFYIRLNQNSITISQFIEVKEFEEW